MTLRRKNYVMISGLVLTLLTITVGQPMQANAAVGDLAGSVNFSTACPSGIGVGITFDGTNLWYSCYASGTDLYRADPVTGVVSASYNIAGGLGALAYDSTTNTIYAGPGGGSNFCEVLAITLDSNKAVTGSSIQFSSPAACTGLDDGLAFDGTDNTLYFSPDGSTIITHFDLAGNVLATIPWHGSGCYNSGLAIGGNLLFEGSDGCNHVWVVNKGTFAPAYDFATNVGSDPGFRDEGLTCDTKTFSPAQVMWSVEAYESRRALAFEIEPGTCGTGGQPAEICGDGIDNDGDGLVDEDCPPPQEICGDGIDNDGDGLIDEDCPPPPIETGRMTGGGSVFAGATRVTHGFEFHCNAAELPNNLEVNWGKNKFHMTNLGTAACSNDPNISEGSPVAGFDTYKGVGTGKLNGVSGAKAEWTFTDAGEPGKNDYVSLKIMDANNNVVLSVTGNLKVGNHQSHP